MNFFSNNLENAFGWMVIHSVWQATAIAIIAGIALILLQKKSAQVRYIVANIALMSVLVAAIVTFSFYYNSGNDINPEVAAVIEKAKTQTIVFQQNTTDALPTIEANKGGELNKSDASKTAIATPKNDLDASKSDIEAPLSISMFKSYFNQHLPLIVMLWLLGVTVFVLRLLGGISYTAYLRNRMNFPTDEYWLETLDNLKHKIGLNQTIELVESALVRSPVVIGHLKPMILFPIGAINRLNPNEVEAILAHEIAHILRKDYLFNIIQSIIEALFYFHPAVWWLSSVIRSERENCCDDVAIKICGNSMTYAKSLISVQEMAFYPSQMAMGFAGTKKNELLIRIQRVLNQPYKNINNMEKIIATAIIIASLIGLTFAQRNANAPKNAEKITEGSFIQDGDAPLSIAGFWNADIKNDKVCVNFTSRGDNWNMMSSDCFNKSEFSNLPTQDAEFQLVRETGTMTFKGKFDGNEGYGKFTFTPSDDFKAYLASELSITKIKDVDLFHLFTSNINKSYIAYLNQNGFNKITKSQLVQLAIHGVNKDVLSTYLASFNKSELSIDKLIQFKIHGVDGDYIKEMRSIFTNLSADELVQGRIHGVDADYITELKNAKVDFSSFDQAVQFKIHGVDGDFAKKMNQANKSPMQPEELVNAKIHDVDPDEVEKMQKSSDRKLTSSDLQNFAIHDVTPEFIDAMNNTGFGKLNVDKLMAAKIHGMTPEWVKQMKASYPKMSFDQVIGFKIHDVSPEFVAAFSQIGYANLSMDNLMAFKIHNVTPSFIKEFKDMGFGNLSADKLIAFKIHGVKTSDVKKYKDLGFADINNDQLIAFNIHNVTPEFIKGIKDAGFKDISADDLIAFKIHNVTPQYIKQWKDKGYDLDADDVLNKKIRGSNGGSKRSNGFFQNDVTPPTPNPQPRPTPTPNPQPTDNQAIKLGNLGNLDDVSETGKVLKFVFNQLKEDGLVRVGESCTIKVAADNWTVNGKSIDANTFKKYNTTIEKMINRKLNKKDKLAFKGKILSFEGDGVGLKGDLTIDFD